MLRLAQLLRIRVLQPLYPRSSVKLRPKRLVGLNKAVQLGGQVLILHLEHVRMPLERF